MSHSLPRNLRRHLLAVCTFLVPLGVVAWMAMAEQQRQTAQTRSSLDREALLLLALLSSDNAVTDPVGVSREAQVLLQLCPGKRCLRTNVHLGLS